MQENQNPELLVRTSSLYPCGPLARIPLIEDLLNERLPVGSFLMVQFYASSQWYAASFAIAAGWVKTGGNVSYNVTSQAPDKIRLQLKRRGLDVERLENEGKLRIFDWYTATLGQKSKERFAYDSLKVADLSIWFSKYRVAGTDVLYPLSPEWLRIYDNVSSLARFNDDKSWVEFWLSRVIPSASLRKSSAIGGFVRKVHGDWVYNTLEAAVDGVIDFKLEEVGKATKNFMRIRSMRNVAHDSEWHRLKIDENFEVTIDKS